MPVRKSTREFPSIKGSSIKLIAKTFNRIFPFILFFLSFVAEPADIITGRETINVDLDGGVNATFIFWNPRTGYFAGTLTIVNESPLEHTVVFEQNIYTRTIYQKSIKVPAASSVRENIFPPVIISFSNLYSQLSLKSTSSQKKQQLTNINLDYVYKSQPDKIPLIRPQSAQEMPDSFNELFSMPQIFLGKKVWENMTERQKQALFDWTFLGGTVCFETDDKNFLNNILEKYPPTQFSNKSKHIYGLGELTVSKTITEKGSKNYILDHIYLSDFVRSFSWESGQINIYLLVFALLVFAFIIGPGTVLVCKKYLKKPILLLAVIPMISLISCVALLLISFWSDGITSRVMNRSITHLDQTKDKAYINQKTAIEVPLGLGKSLDFPENAMIYLNSGNAHSMDFRGYSRAENGTLRVYKYLLPRVPEVIAFTKIEKRREKIEVEEKTDSVKIVNGLGTKIKSMLLRDLNGRYWILGSELPPGGAKYLELCTNTSSVPSQFAALPNSILCAVEKRSGTLELGTYQAELTDNVFGEELIKNARIMPDELFFLVGKYAN